MKIQEIINKIKAYSRGIDFETQKPIKADTTRDQVLFGSTDKECTGIVTTCFASVKVIEQAHGIGANLIICHEALFWNHGDHTEWLEEQHNSVYLRKKKLLNDYGITVWRDHDYIHAGIPDGKGGWEDGIFKGFLAETGLDQYYVRNMHAPVQYNMPVILNFNGMRVGEIASMIIKGAGLNGIRLIGSPDTIVHYGAIPMHIMFNDDEKITMIDQRNIDLIIAMEMIDYTVNEYMRDGIDLGDSKAILTAGHFNTEEPGMKYMLTWLPTALGTDTIPATFIQSGDMNTFLIH